MKYFVKVYETDKGFKVLVYDHGYTTLCEYVNGSWRDCVFSNKDDAIRAGQTYENMWK